MNACIIATGFEQRTVRSSHFAHGRWFLEILGASGSQRVSLMPAPSLFSENKKGIKTESDRDGSFTPSFVSNRANQ
jgi:hypothetical protein